MDKDFIYPLEEAAYSIAHERVYKHENLVIAQELWEMKNHGKPTPHLNGETNDRAYLADLMVDAQKEIQSAIDSLLAKGKLTLWNPLTSLPTTEITGAFVSRNEIVQLMQEKAHVPFEEDSEIVEQSNTNDHDIRYLATASKLLTAFENYGLTKEKLNNLNNHQWLKNARKLKGRGGKNGLEPMYCPHEVMEGLVNKSKTSNLKERRGWEILEQHFPVAYSKFEKHDPRQYDET